MSNTVLVEKHGIGGRDPQDLDGESVNIPDLHATADEDSV